MSDKTTDPTRAPLSAELAEQVAKLPVVPYESMETLRQRVSSLTAENARLRERCTFSTQHVEEWEQHCSECLQCDAFDRGQRSRDAALASTRQAARDFAAGIISGGKLAELLGVMDIKHEFRTAINGNITQIEASTRRAALDEAIALVDASTFSDMGVGGGWLKGPKQIREELDRLRDTPPPEGDAMSDHTPTTAPAPVLTPERLGLLAFVRAKAAKLRESAKGRREMAAIVRGATDESEAAAARLFTAMTCKKTKARPAAERAEEADRHDRIAVKEDAEADTFERIADELQEDEDTHTLNLRLGDLLTGVANALRGQPEPLHLHGWSDLPELAAELRREVARLTADRERIDKSLGGLLKKWATDAETVGAMGYYQQQDRIDDCVRELKTVREALDAARREE